MPARDGERSEPEDLHSNMDWRHERPPMGVGHVFFDDLSLKHSWGGEVKGRAIQGHLTEIP
jgi:hypothetical protein